MSCFATALPVDADGDGVMMRAPWYVDGLPSHPDQWEVPAADLLPGQVWVCEVTAAPQGP